MTRSSPSGASLGFLSVWLLGWSLAVGALSSFVSAEGGLLWLFVFTHGGVEIGVAWALASAFARGAEKAVAPPRLSQDLATMTARWRATPRLALLTAWFGSLGLIIGSVLGVGTWYPVFADPSPAHIFVAAFLSVGWGIIGWRWARTLRIMLRAFEAFSLEATFDRVSLTRKRGTTETTTVLPAANLHITETDHAFTLETPEESITVRCAPSPERERLLQTLRDMANRAREAPFERPPLPAALAAMRTPESR